MEAVGGMVVLNTSMTCATSYLWPYRAPRRAQGLWQMKCRRTAQHSATCTKCIVQFGVTPPFEYCSHLSLQGACYKGRCARRC